MERAFARAVPHLYHATGNQMNGRKSLTLTLSQRERGLTVRGFKNTANQLPLPSGEGWGEGLLPF